MDLLERRLWLLLKNRENVIKELPAGFALPTLCLEQFWASGGERGWWRRLWGKIFPRFPTAMRWKTNPIHQLILTKIQSQLHGFG
jgi:hypothetical protein